MTRIANCIGAILIGSICLAAAVLAGAASARTGPAGGDSPKACCIFMIY